MNNQIYLSFSEMPPIFEDRTEGQTSVILPSEASCPLHISVPL